MTKARELADLAGSSGGGIDVEADRLNQVIQSIQDAEVQEFVPSKLILA